MAEEVWERLSFFESTDFVAEAYKTRHGEDLPASKAHEITSHLRQGREYFESASDAGVLVRPLLLYYGSLALARGLVLFLSPDSNEASLKRKHGLEIKGWEATLTGGVRETPNLTVSVTDGTFGELIVATSNAERFQIFQAPYPNMVSVKTLGADAVPVGTKITIREALERMPDLLLHFHRTFKEFPQCYPAFILMLSPDQQTDFYLLDQNGNLPDDTRIRKSLGLAPDIPLVRDKTHPLLGPIPNFHFRLTHQTSDELFQKAPPIVGNRAGNAFLVAPLADGLRLSSLSIHMVLAFALGMLVRYYPTQWFELVTGEKGDYALPILKASVSLIESNLPRLVLFELEDPEGWPTAGP